MDNKQQLQEGLAALGLNLSTAQQLLLLEHASLLQKWNRTYNLTALRRTRVGDVRVENCLQLDTFKEWLDQQDIEMPNLEAKE